MATFNNQTKSTLSNFVCVDKSRLVPTDKQFLDIGDGHNLLIGGGFKLVIQPAIPAISWSAQTKS